MWERSAANLLLSKNKSPDEFSYLNVYPSTISGISDQASDSIFRVFPYLFSSEVLVGFYAVASMMMSDWVVSKPWLGLAAVLANCLGCAAGNGIMQLLGVDFIIMNMGIPFIMLGNQCFPVFCMGLEY